MPTTKSISVLELVTLLAMHIGVNFISFTAVTKGTSYRKNALDGSGKINPHYKKIEKTATVNIMTGFNYERRLTKVRAADGMLPREVGPSTAGMEHIGKLPLVKSKDNHLCLWCEVRSVSSKAFRNVETGAAIAETELTPFKPPFTTELAYCTYGLENIRTVTIDGTTYNVEPGTYDEAEAAYVASVPTQAELEAETAQPA